MITTKGIAWQWHRDYFIKRFGMARIEEVKARLDPASYDALFGKPIVAISRVSLDAVMSFLRTADQVLGTGDRALIRDCLCEKAQSEIKGIYKIFVAIMSPETVIKRAASVWQHIYQQGKVVVTRKQDKMMEFKITEFEGMPLDHDFTVAVYVEEGLKLCHCKNPRSRILKSYTSGADHCLIEFTWE